MHKVSHHLDRFMKHLLVVFLLLTAASICYATSNVTFSGNGYDMSVLLSDEDCKVVGFNVSGDNPKIFLLVPSLRHSVRLSPSVKRKQSISWCRPRNASHFESKSISKKGHATLGEKKVSVSADWRT